MQGKKKKKSQKMTKRKKEKHAEITTKRKHAVMWKNIRSDIKLHNLHPPPKKKKIILKK